MAYFAATLLGRARLRPLGVAVGLLTIALLGAGCASDSGRPETAAELTVLSPEPNATVPPTNIPVRLRLRNARPVPSNQVGGKIRPDRGHLHLSVDGTPVSMSYGVDETLPQLPPGKHILQAEFVATDHAPFANRVVAAVTFTVR